MEDDMSLVYNRVYDFIPGRKCMTDAIPFIVEKIEQRNARRYEMSVLMMASHERCGKTAAVRSITQSELVARCVASYNVSTYTHAVITCKANTIHWFVLRMMHSITLVIGHNQTSHTDLVTLSVYILYHHRGIMNVLNIYGCTSGDLWCGTRQKMIPMNCCGKKQLDSIKYKIIQTLFFTNATSETIQIAYDTVFEIMKWFNSKNTNVDDLVVAFNNKHMLQ